MAKKFVSIITKTKEDENVEKGLTQEQNLEKLEDEYKYKKYTTLYPIKEGIKNFKSLSKPEQWEIAEDIPLFKKENGKLMRRSYIGYFSKGEDNNPVITAGYIKVRDDVLKGSLIITLATTASYLVGKRIVKKMNSKY